MDYNLTPGINLDNRKIYFNIPSGTTISEAKVIIQTDNANNYIGENTTGGYYHYVEDGDEVVTYFYDSNTNLSNVVLPDGFGTIIEVDTTATLYEYITRKSHEKMYAHSEDFDIRETLDIDGIKAEVEEQARSYGVPIDATFGFDGLSADIPGGYEASPLDLVAAEAGINYVKYDNGILICFLPSSTEDCPGYTDTTITVTLPASYLNTDFLVLINKRNGGAYWANVFEKATPTSVNSVNIYCWNNDSNTAEDIQYNVVTIGKWK